VSPTRSLSSKAPWAILRGENRNGRRIGIFSTNFSTDQNTQKFPFIYQHLGTKTEDLKSLDGKAVWVRVPPPAPRFALTGFAWRGHAKTVRAKRVRHSLSEAKATTDW